MYCAVKSDAVYCIVGGIPIFDELCKRVLNFVLSCFRSDSHLVRFVVKHGTEACMNSPLIRNVTFLFFALWGHILSNLYSRLMYIAITCSGVNATSRLGDEAPKG